MWNYNFVNTLYSLCPLSREACSFLGLLSADSLCTWYEPTQSESHPNQNHIQITSTSNRTPLL